MENVKWEYAVEMLPSPMVRDALNRIGADGWELIAIRDTESPGNIEAYFKRPKNEQ
jgi:hypothetical protein